MELIPPDCGRALCAVRLEERPAMARRGDRTVSYEARVWRCKECSDPLTGEGPLEFIDAQLMSANDAALAEAWSRRHGEPIPPSGRPGRKTDAPLTERVAVLLTVEELARIDARRGHKSRSEFVREVVTREVRGPTR